MENMGRLAQDIQEIVVAESDINNRIKELAQQISADYEGKDLLVVGVLNGSSVFYINLMMELDLMLDMHFIRVSSYGSGTASSGNVRMIYDLEVDVAGKDILVVEDIVDSGNTLLRLKNLFTDRGAASFKCVALLDKPSRRVVDIEADYVGFEVPDLFVVGYGLDYAGKYRNMRFIGVLKPEIYSEA